MPYEKKNKQKVGCVKSTVLGYVIEDYRSLL